MIGESHPAIRNSNKASDKGRKGDYGDSELCEIINFGSQRLENVKRLIYDKKNERNSRKDPENATRTNSDMQIRKLKRPEDVRGSKT